MHDYHIAFFYLAVGHVINETIEEGATLQITIMLLSQLSGRNDSLQANELVAALFEAGDNLGDQTALNAIGLDSNESALTERAPEKKYTRR